VVPTDQRVRTGENFAAALQKFGLTADEAADAAAAAGRAFNLRQLRAGNTITVGRSVEGNLREIDYRIDSYRMLKIVPETNGYTAQVRDIPAHTEIVAVRGTLDDSLFNAVEQSGESPELPCAWRRFSGTTWIFYTDPRRGDTFCILLEKKNTQTGRRRDTARSLQRNMTMPGRNIKRCSTMIRRGNRAITQATENRCKRLFAFAAEHLEQQ